MDLNALKLAPEQSRSLTIKGAEWPTALHYVLSSLVRDPGVVKKLKHISAQNLRRAVNQFLESRRNRIAREALDVANAKKFESLVMKQILIETGKSPLVTRGIFRSRDGKDIEGDSLVALRDILRTRERHATKERDDSAFLVRTQQANRLVAAMRKILMAGNDLKKFQYFSIAAIPVELSHMEDIDDITKVDDEIKSAALSLNGNILYNYVRRKYLRAYKNHIGEIKGRIAKTALASYVLNTSFPHFFTEAVDLKTDELKSKINRVVLSLENPNLSTQMRREKQRTLEKLQRNLDDAVATLTRTKIYNEHSKLLSSIPDVEAKVLRAWERRSLPSEVLLEIDDKFSNLYVPSDLEIHQAEAWTHRSQTYKSDFSDDDDDDERDVAFSSYQISSQEFPELQSDFSFSISIAGKTFTSASHFVLYKLVEDAIALLASVKQNCVDTPDDILNGITGSFAGVQDAIVMYKSYDEKVSKIILQHAVEEALAAFIESNSSAKDRLVKSTSSLIYKSPNSFLGVGPDGTGENFVGATLEKIRFLVRGLPGADDRKGKLSASRQI